MDNAYPVFSDDCLMHHAPSSRLPTRPRLLALRGLAAILAMTSVPALAAQQGEVAGASRASVQITARVAARARVSGVADTALVPAAAAGSATALQRVCISSNSATRRYDLAASGQVAGNGFVIAAEDGSPVPLTLRWTAAGTRTEKLLPGVPLRGLVAAQALCSGETGSTLAIEATRTDRPSVGTITLTVSPL